MRALLALIYALMQHFQRMQLARDESATEGWGCFRKQQIQNRSTLSIQIGLGKGNGDNRTDDFGRELLSGDSDDRYKYRTSSLLNISATAPYFHAGSYDTLEEVVAHYSNPIVAMNQWFDRGGVCNLAQFRDADNCADLYPDARQNTQLALDVIANNQDAEGPVFQNANINPQQQAEVVAFLEALTDPRIEDPEFMSDWIPNPNDFSQK